LGHFNVAGSRSLCGIEAPPSVGTKTQAAATQLWPCSGFGEVSTTSTVNKETAL